MPGTWELRVPFPAGMPLGPALVTASFSSQRDGAVVALASVALRVVDPPR